MHDFIMTERTEPFTLNEVFEFIDDTPIGKLDACELKSRIVDVVDSERNKAIDDLICKIEEHKTKGYVTGITHNPFEFGACQMADDIVKIAEQLKAGDVDV